MEEGKSVALTCRVLNDPTATIRWQKVNHMSSFESSVSSSNFDNPHVRIKIQIDLAQIILFNFIIFLCVYILI